MACDSEYLLELVQGQTECRSLFLRDADGDQWNLSGFSALGQIRDSAGSDLILDLSGYFTNPNESGRLNLNIPSEITKTLAGQSAVYDIFLNDGTGNLTRILYGPCVIIDSITSLP